MVEEVNAMLVSPQPEATFGTKFQTVKYKRIEGKGGELPVDASFIFKLNIEPDRIFPSLPLNVLTTAKARGCGYTWFRGEFEPILVGQKRFIELLTMGEEALKNDDLFTAKRICDALSRMYKEDQALKKLSGKIDAKYTALLDIVKIDTTNIEERTKIIEDMSYTHRYEILLMLHSQLYRCKHAEEIEKVLFPPSVTGLDAVQKGEYNKALTIAEELLKEVPEHPIALGVRHLAKGHIFEAEGKFNEALVEYEAVVKARLNKIFDINSEEIEYTKSMSEGMMAEKKLDLGGAKVAFEQALKTMPGDKIAESALMRLRDKFYTLTGHGEGVASVSFSSEGKLDSGSSDGTIKIWDVSSKKEISSLVGHKHNVYSISFSPDGRLLVSCGGNDGTVKIWDVSTSREIRTITTSPQGYVGYVATVSFSPDGKFLISSSISKIDHTTKVWDVSTGKKIRELPIGVTRISISPDGQWLALCCWGMQKIEIWDFISAQKFREIQVFPVNDYSNGVRCLSFNPDGKLLGSNGDNKTVKIWDVHSGENIWTLSGDSSVTSVSFSPNGKLLASGSYNGTIKIWDISIGKEFRTLRGSSGAVNSVCFSPDGRFLASGNENSTINICVVQE